MRRLIIILLLFFVCQSAFKSNRKLNFKLLPPSLTIDGIPITLWQFITPQYTYRQGFLPLAFRLLQQTDPEDSKQKVRQYIWPWMQNITQEVDKNNLIDRKISDQKTKGMICYDNLHQMVSTTFDNLNLGQSLDIIYPGSFVQGKHIQKGQTLTKLPISHQFRYPIIVAGNGNFQKEFAQSSEAGDVLRTIHNAIWSSQGYFSPDVYVKIINSTELGNFLKVISANKKLCDILGIKSSFNDSINKKRYFIALVQGIAKFFPDKYVLDSSSINDAVGVFLNQKFTIDTAKKFENFGFWGEQNPPHYIQELTYGRIIVASVEENLQTKNLYQKIQQSLLEEKSQKTEELFMELFTVQSLKVTTIGGFEEFEVDDFKSGKWITFYDLIEATSPVFNKIKPIRYTLRDFRGQNTRVTNKLRYISTECQKQKTDENERDEKCNKRTSVTYDVKNIKESFKKYLDNQKK